MKIIEKENKKYYQCEECGHIYEREELANKCEGWCKEHKSCNLEIVKESVNVREKIDFKQLFLGILIGGVLIFVLANFNITHLPAGRQGLTQTERRLGGKIYTHIGQTERGSGGKILNSVNENLVSQIANQVLPSEGFQTRLAFGDTVKKMIDCGVIDLEKMKKLYKGKIPEYIQNLIADQYGFETDKNGYKINKNPHKSVPNPHRSVGPQESVPYPQKSVGTSYPNESVQDLHKSVGAYVYFIEGHIPIEAINKLLTEKPEINGIALPQMPSGSPGMTGFKLSPFKIHSIKNGQDQGIFMEI
jgi:hypothetical protein